MSSRSVRAVVVTYNSAPVLPGLLDSPRAGARGVDDFGVIVADNNSRDRSVEIARAHPLRPAVVTMGRNAGYAAAINAAGEAAGDKAHLLILNPDLRLAEGAVLRLLDHACRPGVGIALPRNLREDGSLDPTVRREPSLATAWCDGLLGGTLAGRLGLGEIVADPAVYARAGAVDWATGSALLIAPQARRAAGDWDETFFLYSEEVDYQRRVREAGLKIVFVPEAEVTHAGGHYRADPRLYALLTTNRIRYFRRNHGPLTSLLFRGGVAAGEALRSWRGRANRAALACALAPLKPALSFRND